MTDPTADAAKLLPCPFCEGPTEIQLLGHMRYIMCFACGAKGSLKPSVDEAVAAWNTRPQPAPPEGEPDDIGWIVRVLRSHCRCNTTQNECCDYCQAAAAVIRLGLTRAQGWKP